MNDSRGSSRSLPLIFLLACAFLIAGNAHALQVDDFNGGDAEVTDENFGETVIYAGAVGGFRTISFLNPDFTPRAIAVGNGV